MADYSNPESLSVGELERFLLDRRLRERVGHTYNDGLGVVDCVLAEAARRLGELCGGKGVASGE